MMQTGAMLCHAMPCQAMLCHEDDGDDDDEYVDDDDEDGNDDEDDLVIQVQCHITACTQACTRTHFVSSRSYCWRDARLEHYSAAQACLYYAHTIW